MNPRPLLALALCALAVPTAPAQPLTARQVVARIQTEVGVPWSEETVDTFKAGDPDAPVTGISVTLMATLDVLQRAAASGHNFIITHEPTFYGHRDETEALEAQRDPVFEAKKAFIEAHGLVVWRFHDHWHRRPPDGIRTGMIAALGWEAFPQSEDGAVFTLPPTTVGALAVALQEKLGIRALRVVGNPDLPVSRAGLAPGFPGFEAQRRLLARPDVDVLVMGEAHEWETILYAADAVAAGMPKALVVLGHIPSEQGGMEGCARWLRAFVSEVPVTFMPAAEPFWSP